MRFNRGYYSIDLKFFFKVTLDVFCHSSRPVVVEGLSLYDKKVVLFGSEGASKIFESNNEDLDMDIDSLEKANMPIARVEVVDPVVLGTKIVEYCDRHCCEERIDFQRIPKSVAKYFHNELTTEFINNKDKEHKRVYVSLGIFTIIKLIRDVQLLIPAYDFCIPDKECIDSTDDSPCKLFEKMRFPVNEFFPPQKFEFETEEEELEVEETAE